LNFKTAQAVEQVVWQLLLAEFPRANNRAKINSLFNGAPPYSADEMRDNHVATNYNDLSATNLDHSARRQISNALTSADPLVTVNLDYGPAHKRAEWGAKITKEWNKPMINCADFLDLREGTGASVVLHGVGPATWEDKEMWLQSELGIEDVLVPSNTLRSLKNLPFLTIFRQYSANQLWKMTHGPRVDPGWNMPIVDQALKWADQQARTLLGQNWPEYWMPEKFEERVKQDSGLFASDAVPTIDCYDFYFWNDDGKQSGWNRRIILDAWGQPGVGGTFSKPDSNTRRFDWSKGQFLYDSGKRIYADKLDKIIHFQFGDASAVAPFRYHSIRSLGFLLYAVCHLQNRLNCRFTDSVFESLMQYFRINNPQDADRLQKVDLIDKGFLPESMQFVRPEERWQVNEQLVESAFSKLRQTMADHSASFTQEYNEESGKGETATHTMATVNSQASLVGSMINSMYARELFRYREIARRFCIPNSKDPDVRKFRVECLKDGVPEEALNHDRWDLQINRVMGGGNKMLEVAIAEKLYAAKPAHGPEAQVEIQRRYDAAITGDWKLAMSLNPESPHISNSMHDTEQTFGTFLAGGVVRPRPGLNAIEVAQTMIQLIQGKVQEIMQAGGVGTPQEVKGLAGAIQYAQNFIAQLAQDRTQKALVKELNDALKNETNEVKAMAQRQQQAAQKATAQNGQDPAAQAKVKAIMMTAQAKIQQGSQSHASKTAQRQLSFEAKQRQDEQKHAFQMQKDASEAALQLSVEQAKAKVELSKRKQLFDEE
jgi:hypothetical protein